MKKIDQNYILKLISKKNHNDENFPVSSFLIDSKYSKHIKNFYQFARISDDIADNNTLDAKEKVRILELFDKLIFERKITDFHFINNLIETLNSQNLSSDNPRKLLKAFIMDASKLRYKNWSELIHYCNHSASPVGRFVVDLHMKNSKKSFKEKIYFGTDNLCNCLQILNHLQDLKDDFIRLNRVYLPMNYIKKEKVKIECLGNEFSNEGLNEVKLRCLEKVSFLLKESKKYLSLIDNKRLLAETLVIYSIAKELTKLIAKKDPLKKKIKLSRIDLIFCFFKGIIESTLNLKNI